MVWLSLVSSLLLLAATLYDGRQHQKIEKSIRRLFEVDQ